MPVGRCPTLCPSVAGVSPLWAGDAEGPAPRGAAPLRARQPPSLQASRKSLSQQLDCPAGRAPVSAAGITDKQTQRWPRQGSRHRLLPGPVCPAGSAGAMVTLPPLLSAPNTAPVRGEGAGKAPCQQTHISPGSPSHCPAGFTVCLNSQG